MVSDKANAMYDWLSERVEGEEREIIHRKKHGGFRELKTKVHEGEVIFKNLSDMTNLPRLKGFKWTNAERLKALAELASVGEIVWTHDGVAFRVLLKPGVGWWYSGNPRIW